MTVPPPRRHLLHRVVVTALATVLLSVPWVGPASTSPPFALAGEAEDADQGETEQAPADDPEDPEGADADAEDAPGDDVEDVLDDPEPTGEEPAGEEPAGPPEADAGPDTETVATLVAIVLLAFLILAHALYRDPRQHVR